MRPHEIEFSTFEGGVFTDLMPYQYGREVCTPGHAFGPARRSHYLFHFILEGKGSLTATDEMGSATVHELHAGEGFLIFPGQITTYVADLDEPWEYIWIEFDGAHVKSNLDRLGFSPASPVYQAQDEERCEQMVDAMRSLLEHRSASQFYLVACAYLFFDAFLGSARPHRSGASSRLHSFYVDNALAYIEQNYQGDITVEDIARNAGLKPQLLRQGVPRRDGRLAAAVPHRVPHREGLRAAQALEPFRGRGGPRGGVPQPAALLARVQERPRALAQGLAPAARATVASAPPSRRGRRSLRAQTVLETALGGPFLRNCAGASACPGGRADGSAVDAENVSQMSGLRTRKRVPTRCA